MKINDLFNLIEQRKKELPEGSYTTSLFREGEDKIIQKVGEEAVEVIIASKSKVKKRIIEEFADLLFHSLILLSYLDIKPNEIFEELDKRSKK